MEITVSLLEPCYKSNKASDPQPGDFIAQAYIGELRIGPSAVGRKSSKHKVEDFFSKEYYIALLNEKETQIAALKALVVQLVNLSIDDESEE